MKLYNIFAMCMCLIPLVGNAHGWDETTNSVLKYVDPRIGTGDHGHVFVGANVPQGMVNVGPTQIETGWDWCSGYHESGDSIVGFGHLHLSGTGCSDLGDIALMPVASKVTYSREGLASPYRHATETVRPGYYSVMLDKENIKAEMTATERVALHRYSFSTNEKSALVIDLKNGIGDNVKQARMYKVDEHTIAGYRISHGWASNQQVYFYMQFSEPINEWVCDGINAPYGEARFNLRGDKQLLVKVALSPVSEANARQNLEAELLGWNFEQVRKDAEKAWEQELSRVKATFATEREARIFYTSMYHFMIAPQTWCDVNGDYMGSDGKVKHDGGFHNYTTWSLWDTYRAAHPLATLIMRDRLTDYAKSMMAIYREQGELPVWHLMSNETYCMVGCPAVPVLADMCLKGVEGIDYKEAFKAMKESLTKDNRSLHWMKSHGYVPYDKGDWEPVAKSLEYYLADWSAAQVAGMIGEKEDSIYFYNRSMNYKKLFDPQLRCMRALDTNGKLRDREGFNPCHQTSDYTEGNPWQYTWLVPHDVHGLVECFPSEKDFVNRLDSLFLASSELNEEANPDITGLIGQYAHGNEPSHHILYMYNYVGQPWKGAKKISQVMNELYTDQPAGLCGNEDVGQMSAWYIMSALGFYQVEPCEGRYMIGSPTIKEAMMNVGEDRTFTVRTHGKGIYVKEVKLNGINYPYNYIMHQDIIKGGVMDVFMSTKPTKWGTKQEYRPQPSHLSPSGESGDIITGYTSKAINKVIKQMKGKMPDDVYAMFSKCFPNTLETTVQYVPDENGMPKGDDTFVITGDINAMWLRDSGAQVWPYLPYMKEDEGLRKLIRGVICRQLKCLCIDPYANAFNREATGSEWQSDYTDMKPELHERKYELDSQCYPIRLAYEYWQLTGDESIFDDTWKKAIRLVLNAMHEQQRKDGLKTSYHFARTTHALHDTMSNWGYGHPAQSIGLIAQAFRPSDDSCVLPFNIPGNFFAMSNLRKAGKILSDVNHDTTLADECFSLANEVQEALKHAVVEHPKYGKIYAYEIDGSGSHLLMDDANAPSLLSLPYLTEMPLNDAIYQNTRQLVWSKDNPYFFEGQAGRGIGSPHTGYDMIWPMSIIMKGLTTKDRIEQQECLEQLMCTNAGTGFMHEAFKKDDDTQFTRSWFAWANTLFGELLLRMYGEAM